MTPLRGSIQPSIGMVTLRVPILSLFAYDPQRPKISVQKEYYFDGNLGISIVNVPERVVGLFQGVREAWACFPRLTLLNFLFLEYFILHNPIGIIHPLPSLYLISIYNILLYIMKCKYIILHSNIIYN
jgi:hypothetical protein